MTTVATAPRPGSGSSGGGGVSEAQLNAAVAAAVAGLVDSAPSSLDTLNELAASLGDDANYAATITAALAGKATTAQGALADSAVQPGDGTDVLNAPAFDGRLRDVSSQDLGTVLQGIDNFADVYKGLYFPDPTVLGGSYSGGEDEWSIAYFNGILPAGFLMLVAPDDGSSLGASDGIFIHDGSGTFERYRTFTVTDLAFYFGPATLHTIGSTDGMTVGAGYWPLPEDPTVATLTQSEDIIASNNSGTWTIGRQKRRYIPFVNHFWNGGGTTTPMEAFRAGDQADPEVRLVTSAATADIDGTAMVTGGTLAVGSTPDSDDQGYWEIGSVAANGADNGNLEVDDFADPKPSEGDRYLVRPTTLNGKWDTNWLFGGSPVSVGQGDTYANSTIWTVGDGMECNFVEGGSPEADRNIAALQTLTDYHFGWHTSDPEVVAPHAVLDGAGLDNYIDGDGGFIKDTGGTLWMAGFMQGDRSGFVPLHENGHDWDYTRAELIDIDDMPAGFDGSGGPIVDLGSGVGMMVLHLEGEHFHKLGAGKVVMDGSGPVSVTYVGDIITPEESQADAITNDDGDLSQGTGSILISDSEGEEYARIFYVEYPDDGTFESHYSIAKCSVADIATAMGSDTAPSFNKWSGEASHEAWTEDGLTGLGSALSIHGPRGGGPTVKLPNGNHLLVTPDSSDGDWYITVSESTDEGLTWSDREELLRNTGTEWYTATAWSGDPDNPEVLTEPRVWMFTTQAVPANRWATAEIARFEIRPQVSGASTPAAPSAIGFDRIEVLTEAELAALAVEDPNTLYLTTES